MFAWLINLVILLILILAQNSILHFLPFLNHINFILLFVIYLVIKNKRAYLALIIFTGYLLDLYSSYTFGVHILSLLIIAFFSNYVYYNILTHHRFFPILLLMLISIVVLHLTTTLIILTLEFLKLLPKVTTVNYFAFRDIGQEILSTVFFISILYLIFYFARRNLRVLFLSPPKFKLKI